MVISILPIIISSFLYALAFICPQFFFWGTLIFLIPIFYLLFRRNISFKEGFIWGLVFYGIHCLAIAVLLFTKIERWLAPIGYGLLVIYFALCSGIWFFLLNKTRRWSKDSSVRLFSASVITLLFNLFMYHYSLIILGRLEGYPFASMLLPLAEYPHLLGILPYVGETMFILYLIVLQACGAHMLVHKSRWLPLIAVGWLPLLITIQTQDQMPEIIKKIGYLLPPQYPSTSGQIAQEIAHKINELKKKRAEVSVIVMPESTFCYPINEHTHVIKTICDNSLEEGKHLLFGGHRSEKGNLYNSLHWMRSSLITQSYDKQHLMLFGESLPYDFFDFIKRNSISLFPIRKTFVRGEPSSPLFRISPDFTFIGSICSELLFHHKKPITDGHPILLITNDAWVEFTPYYQHLFFLLVRYKAIMWQQPIVYVAHSGAWWIMKTGNTYTL